MDIRDYMEQIERQRKQQNAIYHSAAVKYGLSDSAMWVVYMASQRDTVCTQQGLCRQNDFPKQTINSTIAHLVRKGYVTLEQLPGTHNQKRILLTDIGWDLARRTTDPLRLAEERAYAALGEDELEAYLEMTSRLAAALRTQIEEL